ncbi:MULTISPECIES: hypothetical protein [unclassified Psychrobacter]|uniref:hypothetical protein n=1 Tax=unclassified Psychrobacter TaxID=196806 RepID=UPI0025FBE4C1|nr:MULTISPECIES: hypothetical protein [unclassified Psychrobacter]
MKSFKLALLAITTSLLLQGCNDDSDSYQPPSQPDINTKIVGLWSSDDVDSDLSAIAFLDDGSYVQVQVSDNPMNNPDNGMEWGKYNINSKTGELTTKIVFDKNGNAGLSDSIARYAKVANGKLILEVDENNNGVIDSNEIYKFSQTQQKGMVGYWRGEETDENLESVAFFENGTYFHVQVDEEKSLNNPENGLEWGNYTIDSSTGLLETSQLFDDNGINGLSEPRTRYARVSDDNTLTIEVDENQNGIIDVDENFDFSRAIVDVKPDDEIDPKDILGLWEATPANNELSTLAFLEDGTYLQMQVDEDRSLSEPGNGMEWGKYSLGKNSTLITSQTYDGNDTSGLSDNILRTVKVVNNTLTLGVDENDNGVIDSKEYYTFSKAKSENLLGIWDYKETDHELLKLIFFENGTYVQLEVDEKPPFVAGSPFSGMEWGDYSINNLGLLTTSQRYDDNGESGLSDPINRYVRVSNNILTLDFDENSNGMIDSDETLNFKRQ